MNMMILKFMFRFLILMIFFVILFMILAVLYSTRYWPDIYNYVHSNITIKRIPTLSELNLTILEVDGTTELYTTDDYTDSSTIDDMNIDMDDFFNSTDDQYKFVRPKRYALEDFGKDYSEIPKKNVVVDYLFLEETTTAVQDISVKDLTAAREDIVLTKIVKDLINESKLVPKNYGDVEIMDSLNEVASETMTDDNATDVSTVFPWISTIFVKNDSKSNQFEYFCDGALLNERLLITAARCVMLGNSTVGPDSLLVILGKRSLLSMADKEQAVKIKQIITHENFTTDNGKVENDLALLVIENPVVFNDIIQPTIIGNDTDKVEKSFTTAWNLQGDLVPVAFEDKEVQACNGKNVGEHKFCATYGLKVALCPSYGGVFAGYQADGWRLYGIRSGDTTDRGVCFDKNVWFTDLTAYEDWIMEHFE